MGRALWMATIALRHAEYGPVPVDAWGETMRKVAHRYAQEVLRGAGVPESDRVSEGNITLIYRRQCTDDERRRVPEPFLACGIERPR